MDIVKSKGDCCGCHACYNICPVNAIEMRSDEEGFWYPVILQDKCTNCGQCQRVCPALNKPASLSVKLVFGCYSNNERELMSSSSGGIFAVFSRKILSLGGVVCGAAFNKNMEVEHIIIDSENDLSRLQGTKYVQSRVGNAYSELKKYLDAGREVLFSGTPCQVAGLKSYLKKEYDNLFCIDLICHGAPSPEIWRRYLNEISDGEKVKYVTFRNKTEGISNITLDYKLESGRIIREKYSQSNYIKGFIQSLFLRPSCYDCKFKGAQRCSDITIGDFWAMKEFHPDSYQEYGVSAVVIHSDRGEKLFSQVSGDVKSVKATVEEVGCWNECFFSSVQPNDKRKDFFASLKENTVSESVGKYAVTQEDTAKKSSAGVMFRIKRKIKSILR